MKIYCSRAQFNDSHEELWYYIERICNKDLWLALREEDLYYKWIRAYRNGSYITFSSVHNSAYFPKEYFYDGIGYFGKVGKVTARDINLDACVVVHPVMMLSTEELSNYISSNSDRFRFDFVEEDD